MSDAKEDLVELERARARETQIRKTEGGNERCQQSGVGRWSTMEDYDLRPVEKQLAEQQQLGAQRLAQITIKNPVDVAAAIRIAMKKALEKAKFSNDHIEEFENLGDGRVFIALSSEGSATVVWDGDRNIDVNLFMHESPNRISPIVTLFTKTLRKVNLRPSYSAKNDFPRGTGRIVSFQDDIIKSNQFRPQKFIARAHYDKSENEDDDDLINLVDSIFEEGWSNVVR